MELISLKGLGKSFKKKSVLENISLSVKNGESLGIVGRSGSGKSVLIKILIGFLNQDYGVKIIGPNVADKIGFSIQNNSLYDYLTVKQNFNYFCNLYKIPRKKRKDIISEIIEKLDLKEYEKVIVKKLSGGTKKRVDIGCALLNNPEILILDEPFLGLDPELTHKLGEFILKLNKSGKTIIVSSHRIGELKKICSRFVSIKNKKLSSIGKNELINAYL